MNKKGFTLIELLAVIVILAIIAIIVTPVVTGIITKAKLSADMRSAEGYVKAAEDYFAGAQINDTKKSNINTNIADKIEISGNKPNGELVVDDKGRVSMAVNINNKCYKKESFESDISIIDDIDKCSIISYVVPPDRCFTTYPVDGGVTITKYLCGDSVATTSTRFTTYNNDGEFVNVQVPESIGGVNVVGLDGYSFAGQAVGDKVGVKNLKMTTGGISSSSISNNEVESIILSNDLTNITSFSIIHNHNIKYLRIPGSVTSISSLAAADNNIDYLEFEDGPTEFSIGASAFVSDGIKKVKFSKNIIGIGVTAFSSNLLENVELPPKLTVLNIGVFRDNRLKSIDLSNITSIGAHALASNQLKSVDIPETLIDIGNGAFNGNNFDEAHAYFYASSDKNGDGKLTDDEYDKTTLVGYAGAKKDNVEIPSSVTTIGTAGMAFAKINSITIPNTVTTLEAAALKYNNLSEIVIPSSLNSIPNVAFANNPLTKVIIPNTITSIGYSAFDSCVNLESIDIPNSVTSMDINIFYNTPALKNINIDNTTNSISGSRWGAAGTAKVNWLR